MVLRHDPGFVTGVPRVKALSAINLAQGEILTEQNNTCLHLIPFRQFALPDARALATLVHRSVAQRRA